MDMIFIMFVVSWLLIAILLVALILTAMFTPALTFFGAWMGRKGIARLITKGRDTVYRACKEEMDGILKVDGYGFVINSDNSSTNESKSKLKIYDVYTEYASSIPSEFPAIVQELRELGYTITNYDEYKALIDLASNPKEIDNYLQRIDNEEIRAELEKKILKLSTLKIQIKPNKTYKMFDLSFMFPNNITPEKIESKIIAETNKMIKKQKLQNQMMIYLGIFILITVVATAIAWKMIKSGDCPACVCQVARSTFETAKAVAQTNLTI